MKITLTEKAQKPNYPVLKRHKCTEYNSVHVVLFSGPGEGILLSYTAGNDSKGPLVPVGSLYDSWAERYFTNFSGSITLEND